MFDEENGILQGLEEDPLSPDNVYAAMIAMQESCPEDMWWTNDNFYEWSSFGCAVWK